jgi:spermidine synthase
MAGVANLFTLEQFRLMQKRLAPHGVVCQWLNTYSMSPMNIQMIIKTFRSVFPQTSLWQTIGADLLLVGSNHEIVYDLDAIDREIQNNTFLRKDLNSFKVFDAAGLLSCFMLNDEELGKMSAQAPVNSDNLPLLEYSAPLNLYGYEQVVYKNLEMINAYRIARYPRMIHEPLAQSQKIRFHNAIGRAALEKGDFTTAAAEIAFSNTEQALNPGAVLNHGIFQLASQKIPEAIANFENYLAQDPASADAQFYLAKAYMAKGEVEKAAALCAKAVAATTDQYDYMMMYAQTLAQGGNVPKAVEIAEKAIEIKGMTFSNGLLLANLLFASREPEKAVAALEHLLSIYPHSFGGYEALARIFESANAFPQAIAVYQRASKAIPFDARAYYALSLLYEKINDRRSARLMAKRYTYYQNAPKIGTSPKP